MRRDINTAAMIAHLQATMADDVGPFRTEAKLARALATIDDMTAALGERPVGDGGAFDLRALDWFDLRNMLHGRTHRRTRRRWRAPKAAARTSARIFPACCRNGASTRWRGWARPASRSTPVPVATQAAAQ